MEEKKDYAPVSYIEHNKLLGKAEEIYQLAALGDEKALDNLLNTGQDIDQMTNINHVLMTPAGQLAREQRYEAVNLLRSRGADLDSIAIGYGMSNSSDEIDSLLVQHCDNGEVMDKILAGAIFGMALGEFLELLGQYLLHSYQFEPCRRKELFEPHTREYSITNHSHFHNEFRELRRNSSFKQSIAIVTDVLWIRGCFDSQNSAIETFERMAVNTDDNAIKELGISEKIAMELGKKIKGRCYDHTQDGALLKKFLDNKVNLIEAFKTAKRNIESAESMPQLRV